MNNLIKFIFFFSTVVSCDDAYSDNYYREQKKQTSSEKARLDSQKARLDSQKARLHFEKIEKIKESTLKLRSIAKYLIENFCKDFVVEKSFEIKKLSDKDHIGSLVYNINQLPYNNPLPKEDKLDMILEQVYSFFKLGRAAEFIKYHTDKDIFRDLNFKLKDGELGELDESNLIDLLDRIIQIIKKMKLDINLCFYNTSI